MYSTSFADRHAAVRTSHGTYDNPTSALYPPTMHYITRKKEYERIDSENKKIKRSIDGSKPIVSFNRLEKEFREKHVRIRSLIAKGNNRMPIDSFMKKKMELMNQTLPPLESPQSSFRKKQAKTSMGSARPSPLSPYDLDQFTNKYDMRLFVEAYNQAAGGPEALNVGRTDYFVVQPDAKTT